MLVIDVWGFDYGHEAEHEWEAKCHQSHSAALNNPTNVPRYFTISFGIVRRSGRSTRSCRTNYKKTLTGKTPPDSVAANYVVRVSTHIQSECTEKPEPFSYDEALTHKSFFGPGCNYSPAYFG